MSESARALAFLIAALALAVTGGGARGEAHVPMALVDRTLTCPLVTSDGFRLLSVWGIEGNVGVGGFDASARVVDELALSPQSVLASAEARGLAVSRRCSDRERAPFQRKGLPGPPGIFTATYDCESRPREVVIRLRAVVASGGRWRRQGASVVLRRAVASAQLSVQTPSRVPFGHVTIAGKQMRILVSPDCVRD